MSIGARGLRWLILACAVVLLAGCQSEAEQVKAARTVLGNQPVILLSASWCGYCKQLRTDFKRWGVPYAEFDVEKDDKGRLAYHDLHGRGIPITLVGMQRVDGYAPKHIHKLIANAAASGQYTPNHASGD